MHLTKAEFLKIRPLNWTTQTINGKITYTTLSPQLFWLDFVKFVFLPYFRQQNGITTITNFDINQPVVLFENLELKLSNTLESIVYFAKNQKLITPTFNTYIPQLIILLFTFFAFLILFICSSLKIDFINEYKFLI